MHCILYVQIGWAGKRRKGNAGSQTQVNICSPNGHGHCGLLTQEGLLLHWVRGLTVTAQTLSKEKKLQ